MRLTKEEVKQKANNGVLFLNDKNIITIEAFPKGLKKIHVSNNNLCHLPDLPSGLIELYCYNNNLIDLPDLPKSLRKLDCSGNCIDDLSFDLDAVESKHTNKVNADKLDILFEEIDFDEDNYEGENNEY